MVWVIVFAAIALIGIVTVLGYAIWLWHKASDLFSEIEMLGRRAEELAELVGRIELPGATAEQHWESAAN